MESGWQNKKKNDKNIDRQIDDKCTEIRKLELSIKNKTVITQVRKSMEDYADE